MALSLVSVVETLRIMRARLSANSMRTLRRPPSRDRQSGAVAVLVGIALLAMIGITGLALDLGKLYVVKSELQNSADACAIPGIGGDLQRVRQHRVQCR